MKILRPKVTAEKCGVHTITIARWSSDPAYSHLGFPKKISLGKNSVGYSEELVDAFLEARAAASGASE